MCPKCGSNDISIREYDFGACRQTGYRDAGERFTCRACGAEGDVGELERDLASSPSERAA